MVNHIFKRGGVLYPATPQGVPISKLSNPDIQITSRERLIYFYKRGIERFVFRPESAGLVALDIDLKNGKDGLTEFLKIHFVNFEDQYPYTKTPSGGYHIYFKNPGKDFVSCEIAEGLEVKHRALITLPGSISDKGKYVSFNDESYLKPLPDDFLRVLPVRKNNPDPPPPPPEQSLNFDKILSILQKQGYVTTSGNRNNFTFEFSKLARKQGHDPESVKNYLSYIANDNFSIKEISATVQSAFKGRC